MSTSFEKLILLRRALKWWNSLTKSQQRDFEYKTFGYGDHFEDNTLTELDIVQMYKQYILKVS